VNIKRKPLALPRLFWLVPGQVIRGLLRAGAQKFSGSLMLFFTIGWLLIRFFTFVGRKPS
jgi:hypothetical protein